MTISDIEMDEQLLIGGTALMCMDWQYYGGLAGALLGLAVALLAYTRIVITPTLRKYA